MSNGFTPYRVVFTHVDTNKVVFDDVIAGSLSHDDERNEVFTYEHLQIIEDLHELFPDKLKVTFEAVPNAVPGGSNL